MRIANVLWRAVAGVLVLTASAAGLAQDSKTKFTSLLNVDALVDNYARFLARKYNLNEEQEQFTVKLMHDKADAFLANHREPLFGLVDRMFEVRTGGEMDPGELVNWGRQVAPIYEEAKKIIVDGNNEFRSILNDQQKAIHDQDLKMMEDSFAQTDDQLQRIVAGQMTVEEFRNPKPRQVSAPPPSTPLAGGGAAPHSPAPAPPPPTKVAKNPAPVQNHSKPPIVTTAPPPMPITPPPTKGGGSAGKGSPPPPPVRPASAQFEGEWDQYTRQFIQRFQLDEPQTAKAETILKDCKEQASRYVRTKQSQIKALDEREAKLREGPPDASKQKDIQAVQQEKNKLFEPLTLIFEKQLKPRLDRLPTAKQRREAESGKAAPRGNNSKGAAPPPATPAPNQPPVQPPVQPPPPPPPPVEPPPPPPEEPPVQPGEDPPTKPLE